MTINSEAIEAKIASMDLYPGTDEVLYFDGFEVLIQVEQETDDIFGMFGDCYGTINGTSENHGNTVRINTGRDLLDWTYPDDMQINGENHKQWASYDKFIEARKNLRERVESYFRDEWTLVYVSLTLQYLGEKISYEALGGIESDHIDSCIIDNGMIDNLVSTAGDEYSRVAYTLRVKADNIEKLFAC